MGGVLKTPGKITKCTPTVLWTMPVMDIVWPAEVEKTKQEAREEGVEDLYEFITITKKCYFCDQPRTILTNDHWVFCPHCMALYTFHIVHSSECKHIKNGVPTVMHESAYNWKTPYIRDKQSAGTMNCSKCNAECEADGL